MHRPSLTLLLLTCTAGTAALAQNSLRDALRMADRAAYGNRIAAGTADAQQAQTLLPMKGILPTVRFEAGWVRTTDPIGVFGTTLRQRAVTPANFDPARLNFPGATANYTGGMVLEAPIFNADAWTGRQAATLASSATRAAQDWTRVSTRVDVIRAWFGAALAAEQVTMLRRATAAARSHVAQADAMVRQGMVTRSDALLAAVRAGGIESQLLDAQGAALLAERQLQVLLGGDGTVTAGRADSVATLPTSTRIRELLAADTMRTAPQDRADVRAATSARDAATADARRARSAYLPRINSFARLDWNSPARIYGGDHNWTVGIMSSWTPFAGGSELADVQVAAGRRSAAQAQAAAAQASARLDVEKTRIELGVALARLEIAERAVAQSSEATRIVRRKYEGGLAGITDLLDAQASETQSALGFAQARYAVIVAAAERRRALGGDPASLSALDDRPTSSLTPDTGTAQHAAVAAPAVSPSR